MPAVDVCGDYSWLEPAKEKLCFEAAFVRNVKAREGRGKDRLFMKFGHQVTEKLTSSSR